MTIIKQIKQIINTPKCALYVKAWHITWDDYRSWPLPGDSCIRMTYCCDIASVNLKHTHTHRYDDKSRYCKTGDKLQKLPKRIWRIFQRYRRRKCVTPEKKEWSILKTNSIITISWVIKIETILLSARISSTIIC